MILSILEGAMKIRMSSPDLVDADRKAVLDVVQTPNLSMGPKIEAFEKAFCELTGAKHAIGVNSGTAGLHPLHSCGGRGGRRPCDHHAVFLCVFDQCDPL